MGCPTSMAVPMALVPHASSLQLAPDRRWISAAASRSRGSPSRLRMTPAPSVSTMTVPVSARSSRAEAITGWLASSSSLQPSRRECSESSRMGGGACARCGSTLLLRQRRQESSTSRRSASEPNSLPPRNFSHERHHLFVVLGNRELLSGSSERHFVSSPRRAREPAGAPPRGRSDVCVLLSGLLMF